MAKYRKIRSCDPELWPMTLKFDRVLEVIEAHVHAQFHQAKCSTSWGIVVAEKKNKKKLHCDAVKNQYCGLYCRHNKCEECEEMLLTSASRSICSLWNLSTKSARPSFSSRASTVIISSLVDEAVLDYTSYQSHIQWHYSSGASCPKF